MSLTCLVVDNAQFVRWMLSDILRKTGHEVIAEADNGEQAVSKFRAYKPDIVLLDLMLPVMDGLTALKQIKSIDPKAVVLICSAISQRELIAEALQAGANGYIMKPFAPDTVRDAINLVEGKARLQASAGRR